MLELPLPPEPAPAPAPVPAELQIAAARLQGAPLLDGRRHALVGQRIVVRLLFAPGQVGSRVQLRWRREGQTVRSATRTIQPVQDDLGAIVTALRVPTHGALALTAELEGSEPALATVAATLRAHGPSTMGRDGQRLVSRRLAALRFLGSATASPGARARAVRAFQQVNGLPGSGRLDGRTLRRLARGGRTFRVRHPGHGRHIEADLSRQVLAQILPGGRVRRVYPISSGKPSTPTIRGSFSVYHRALGTNAKGMVDAAYFIRGYAIHGYYSVPTYAASHGCLRVFLADARPIHDWVRIGTRVDVY